MARARISRLTALFTPPPIFLLTSILALFALGFSSRQAQATVYYVSTIGTGNGSSWATAGPLQPIITAAHAGDQVWVKQGTYTGNFTATDGVAVYGGFNGTETSIGQRNITANVTILDGNNSGTVYTIPSAATRTNTLDGFTIKNNQGGGLSDEAGHDTLSVANCTFTDNIGYEGGGIYDDSATANITNCTFTDNGAAIGGGADISSTTTNITNCHFMDNNATGGDPGGGMRVGGTTANIEYCTFTHNGAGVYGGIGGGIYVYSTTANIKYCTFADNIGDDGGGGIADDSPTANITNCTFTGNMAIHDGYNGYGGGVYAMSGTATITSCMFLSNSAEDGGGVCANTDAVVTINGNSTFTSNNATDGGDVYASHCTPIIEDCVFDGSYASNVNNAIYLSNVGDTSTTPASPAVIKNCLIVGAGTSASDPDGVDVEPYDASYPTSNITLANNTIVKTNIGINFASNSGTISVANNILYGNGGGLNVASSVPTVTLFHNDFFNNVGYNAQGASLSATDLMVDPLFVNFANGDYHLLLGSPVIDKGDDSYVAHGDTDLDGHPRIMGAHVDIGAYEGTESATLSAASPSALQAGSAAFTLTLTGTYFLSTSVVDWNGTALTTTYVSATQITASVPASLVATAGSAVVTVANPGAYASKSLSIEINPVATLSSLSPASIPTGSPAFTLTVNGTKFVNGAVVSFKGAALATTYVSATQLTASVPTTDLTAMGTASVTVANPGTAASNALAFTVTAALVPAITSVSPTSGLVGSVVTITGTNLAGVTAVQFHTVTAPTFSVNAAGTQINVLVPSGATTGTISVTAPGGTATSSQTFTVLFPPTITSFTPTSGPVGTVVTITGTNFTGATVVGFTGAHATSFTVNGAGTQITATVPSGAMTGPIAVATPYGTAHSSASFTVTAASTNPTITGFSPTSGPVGTVVTITGTNFTGTTVVGFTGAHASFTVNSSTQITATVPTGAVTGPIAVATPNGTAKSSASFTVTTTAGPPTITSFTPTSGPVGTVVTITGTNLSGTTVVGFQGQHAKTFTVNGAGTQITATVPTGAVTGQIAVATPAGTAKSSASYTVTP